MRVHYKGLDKNAYVTQYPMFTVRGLTEEQARDLKKRITALKLDNTIASVRRVNGEMFLAIDRHTDWGIRDWKEQVLAEYRAWKSDQKRKA